jgi:hypothetical protein
MVASRKRASRASFTPFQAKTCPAWGFITVVMCSCRNVRQLSGSKVTLRQAVRIVVIPHQAVPADFHPCAKRTISSPALKSNLPASRRTTRHSRASSGSTRLNSPASVAG